MHAMASFQLLHAQHTFKSILRLWVAKSGRSDSDIPCKTRFSWTASLQTEFVQLLMQLFLFCYHVTVQSYLPVACSFCQGMQVYLYIIVIRYFCKMYVLGQVPILVLEALPRSTRLHSCPFFGVAVWKTSSLQKSRCFFLLLFFFFFLPASMLHVKDSSSVFINVVDKVKCRILKKRRKKEKKRKHHLKVLQS